MIVLGAMSGTSTDGIDIAAIHMDPQTAEMRFLGLSSQEFPPSLRQDLLVLQQIPPAFPSEIDPLCMLLQARRDLSLMYVDACLELLAMLGLESHDVRVVGAHGQTIRHRPDLGYTCQMLDGALVAARLGIDVVCDLRSKDVALGGQGAPLVPAFHQAWLNGKGIFGRTGVLNLGGFSNLTLLNGHDLPVSGGDCGPANCLMDLWAQRAFRVPMDEDGLIASSGQPFEPLLDLFLQHPFFSQVWPKSTGRDDFNERWFDDCLAVHPGLSDEDVMATLMAFAVRVIQLTLPQDIDKVYVCGGGIKNTTLMNQLRLECAPVEFLPIENLGLPAQAVEAAAFAWLAAQNVTEQSGNCPAVTGAHRLAILGALHRAG